jgi:D-amino-acid dehydrogenase
MKNIAIVGGGIIGLSTAYYLNQSGHRVTIFDKGDLNDNSSVGNAGMIVPSHIIPLAAPGMISKGIRWMLNSKSPFYVRPRLSKNLIKWGMKFYAHANHEHVMRSIPLLKEISSLSKQLYQQLAKENHFDFGYEERGLLMLFKTSETEKEELEAAKLANKVGVEARVLSLAEAQHLEPVVKLNARGAIFFPGDAHLNPKMLINRMTDHIQRKGVAIFPNTIIEDFVIKGDQIKGVRVQNDVHMFDELIVAAGAWSGMLCSRLSIDLPMQSGKGYSFTLDNVVDNVRIPTLLLEGRVAVTPMGSSLRFGGTMEIGDTNTSINMNRVKGIFETIPKYYPEMNVQMPDEKAIWSGLRPCSPDGLPYIGRSSKLKNLIIATGHSMMGMSLGPATGKLVAELVDEVPCSMDLAAFNPERFGSR